MNKLMKMFPVLALVLGVGFAVATAAPKPMSATTKMANDDGEWIDVTHQELGTDYRCSSNPEPICTQVFVDGVAQPSTIVRGEYQPL